MQPVCSLLLKSFLTFLLMGAASSLAAPLCRSSAGDFFNENKPLKWTIQGDFKTVNDWSIYLPDKKKAFSDGWLRTEANEMPVRISARGAFRYEECHYRPFRLQALSVHDLGAFPFLKGFKKVKLTTICNSHQEYRQIEIRQLMKEYTIYKMLMHFSGPRMDARLVQLDLRNPDGTSYLVAPGFIRESESALAKRCDLREREPTIKKWDNERKVSERWILMKDRTIKPYLYVHDSEAFMRMELINKFLNNPDYIVDFDHNLGPLVSKDEKDLREYLIPYDFDLSQAAGGTFYTYEKSVEQKAIELYEWLGSKEKENASLTKALRQEFVQALPSMLKEIEASPLLDEKGRADLVNWVRAYINVFKSTKRL